MGASAKARKGSSFDHVAKVLGRAEAGFPARCSTGLSSGEGLVWALRDPDGADPGAADPRLLVVEPEFASVLKATSREACTLSPVLRSAWDGRALALLTRTAPARSTAAHLSVIGHITSEELAHHATSLDVANGLLNRFVFISCRRARLLPEGGGPDPLGTGALPRQLAGNLAAARRRGLVSFSPAAQRVWREAYLAMSEPYPGLVGGLLARSEAHVLRLALLYALVDGAVAIDTEHLLAGLALWDYSARSVAALFGGASGNPVAEQVHAALVASGAMTRTDLRDLFSRNCPSAELDDALRALQRAGRAEAVRVVTGGRPAQLWHATANGQDASH